MSSQKKICIWGTGGFGREVLCLLTDVFRARGEDTTGKVFFIVDDEFYSESRIMGIDVLRRSDLDSSIHTVSVAIGEPAKRRAVVESLPAGTEFPVLIHPAAVISDWAEFAEGAVITAGVIATCNIKIGKHAHLNLHTTIGHDCVIGDYFTTAPGVNISGSCEIGNNVYIGTNASVKQGIRICDDVTIGMGAVVVKNIEEPGTYIGNPAVKFKK